MVRQKNMFVFLLWNSLLIQNRLELDLNIFLKWMSLICNLLVSSYLAPLSGAPDEDEMMEEEEEEEDV